VSGPSRPLADADDPALDPGVLAACPLGEWNGWQAVRRHGGTAVLPWRGDWLAARAAGIDASPVAPPPGSLAQALVRVQKGRDATWDDLMNAWMALAEGGRLLVAGGNDVGIATWAKRVAALHGQPGEVLANHSRSRVVLFRRQGLPQGGWPGGPSAVPLWPPAPGAPPPPLVVVPQGVFSHGGLDEGTALLVSHLAQEAPAARVLDLGCGAGHLGFNALLRWPQSRVWFVDADARAHQAVLASLGGDFRAVRERAEAAWWDVSEPLPAADLDLVLCNPPCHAGTAPDLTTARAMFRIAAAALVPGGRLLVVANRQLPYEADLAALGRLETLAQQGGFKLLALTRA
jgi:16S rRNA (guanine1207-N2)-methyltransferase